MKLKLLFGAATAVALALAGQAFAYTFKVEEDAQISTSMDAVQQAVNLVRAYGYSCDSVLIFRNMAFTRGYVLVCNRAAYEYEIVDKGGNWTVEYVD